jgi:hypothetical protein
MLTLIQNLAYSDVGEGIDPSMTSFDANRN